MDCSLWCHPVPIAQPSRRICENRGGSPTEVGSVRKSSQKGRVPHLSLQISNSGETCALPFGPLASPQQMIRNGFPRAGWSSYCVLQLLQCGIPGANCAASKARSACRQLTHLHETESLGHSADPPRCQTSACDDVSKWLLLILVLHYLSKVPPTCHRQTSQIA